MFSPRSPNRSPPSPSDICPVPKPPRVWGSGTSTADLPGGSRPSSPDDDSRAIIIADTGLVAAYSSADAPAIAGITPTPPGKLLKETCDERVNSPAAAPEGAAPVIPPIELTPDAAEERIVAPPTVLKADGDAEVCVLARQAAAAAAANSSVTDRGASAMVASPVATA